ncbi:TPA: hypothetical protein ACRTM4_004449 [Aeromonas hydrophila]|uniref:hypothetical protein n=1 Tax=Aeromonas TaxID=642 RepID=UPI001600DBA5|nr:MULTISPECIES: hypothetical protein [Aeromonas]MCR3951179.1 hypothetical protein [Aeromonas hydrophila]MDM5076452.1 hypothetical protein [Aeromonas media]HEB5077405.1 hypothetical protein [Aeromonas hydrophila subsp. hydrophila]
MNFESFFHRLQNNVITLPLSSQEKSEQYNLLDNEALFQLPLISIIILVLAKDKRKPKVAEVGQLVGECIESSFLGFKGSTQHIGWSANLRIRTVKSMSFLENAGLITINNRKDRLQITELGKKVIDRANAWDENLEYNLSLISRSYRNICVSRQLDSELE